MIKEAIVKIVNKGDLTYEEAYTVMNEIMGGETTPTQNAAFLPPSPPRAPGGDHRRDRRMRRRHAGPRRQGGDRHGAL